MVVELVVVLTVGMTGAPGVECESEKGAGCGVGGRVDMMEGRRENFSVPGGYHVVFARRFRTVRCIF